MKKLNVLMVLMIMMLGLVGCKPEVEVDTYDGTFESSRLERLGFGKRVGKDHKDANKYGMAWYNLFRYKAPYIKCFLGMMSDEYGNKTIPYYVSYEANDDSIWQPHEGVAYEVLWNQGVPEGEYGTVDGFRVWYCYYDDYGEKKVMDYFPKNVTNDDIKNSIENGEFYMSEIYTSRERFWVIMLTTDFRNY